MNRKCSKCGYTDIQIRYEDGSKANYKEYLVCLCKTCLYMWTEQTLDKTEFICTECGHQYYFENGEKGKCYYCSHKDEFEKKKKNFKEDTEEDRAFAKSLMDIATGRYTKEKLKEKLCAFCKIPENHTGDELKELCSFCINSKIKEKDTVAKAWRTEQYLICPIHGFGKYTNKKCDKCAEEADPCKGCEEFYACDYCPDKEGWVGL